jgi:uncharacterized protein (TIGR02118 family)
MIKVSVLYPNDEGAKFDMAYYVDKHMGMVQRVLGSAMLKFEIEEGISGAAPDSRPTYRAAVHMYFASTEAFYAAFGPHAKAILGDVPNYTDVRPITQISAVVGV